jgi:hypothetical protein
MKIGLPLAMSSDGAENVLRGQHPPSQGEDGVPDIGIGGYW